MILGVDFACNSLDRVGSGLFKLGLNSKNLIQACDKFVEKATKGSGEEEKGHQRLRHESSKIIRLLVRRRAWFCG